MVAAGLNSSGSTLASPLQKKQHQRIGLPSNGQEESPTFTGIGKSLCFSSSETPLAGSGLCFSGLGSCSLWRALDLRRDGTRSRKARILHFSRKMLPAAGERTYSRRHFPTNTLAAVSSSWFPARRGEL